VTALVRSIRAHIASLGRHRKVAALVVSILVIGAVTGLVFLLDGLAPVLSLGALYVLAVLPVAVLFGRAWAIGVSVVSMLLFNFVFIPPTLTLTLHGSENWLVFAVYVVTGLLVADLAARARRRARIAEDREREAALLAELSTTLLSGASVEAELPRIAEASARLLGATGARIELGSAPSPPDAVALPLRVGDQRIGTLVLTSGVAVDASASSRFLPALASVIGIGLDRERLAHEALETEALRRSDLLKTALLRAVSHDLRSPLTAIRASLEALTSVELQLDEGRRDALLHSALVESERLDRMVRNLLDLSRLQAGAARPAPRVRPIDGLLDTALRQFPLDEWRIDVACSRAVPLVNVDPAQLERVLVNLLENALKFSPADARVEVDVTQQGNEVQLRVADHGPGLSAVERERVFEPFQRGAATRAGSGAGLGLAIARGFVEANGGRLWAEASGEGATFVVALPASADPLRAAV
jgi:two-component system sensor histidine kinase KdpD